MKTQRLTSLRSAARLIRHGDLVAFPTETVYGLGANVFDESAVKKIFIAKGRPSDNPLIVHVASARAVWLVAREIPPTAKKLIDAFFPAPLTLILPKQPTIPDIVTAGLNGVGIRVPQLKLARNFIKCCGVPIAAPSANLSGRPSPTTWQDVAEDLSGRIAAILKGPAARVGIESTVVDCTGRWPVVLRSGSITLEALQKVVPQTTLVSKAAKHLHVKSPGMRYRHYSPKAKVILVSRQALMRLKPNARAAFIGLREPSSIRVKKVCPSVEHYARSLFGFFRACDRLGVAEIYCERVAATGLGRALMNRLIKASSGI
jgi:L-threonylcarbamoyladenylate synthase